MDYSLMAGECRMIILRVVKNHKLTSEIRASELVNLYSK